MVMYHLPLAVFQREHVRRDELRTEHVLDAHDQRRFAQLDDPLVGGAYLGRSRIPEDGAKAREHGFSPIERLPAGMDASDDELARPQSSHRAGVAGGERLVKALIRGEYRLFGRHAAEPTRWQRGLLALSGLELGGLPKTAQV